MIIDNKGRLFGRISIIDIIIVLAVIAVLAGAAYKMTGSRTISPLTQLDTLEIKFYQDEAPSYAAKAVEIGDHVADFERGTNFGKVTDVKLGESEGFVEAADGRFVMAPKEGYSSIYITVEVQGIYTDSGINVSNSDYYLGRTVGLRAGKSVFWTRIISMEKKE